MKILRIIFTIISAVFGCLVLPLFAFSIPWGFLSLILSLVFFGLMKLSKQSQEINENKNSTNKNNDNNNDNNIKNQ